jgi:hypothetical protein
MTIARIALTSVNGGGIVFQRKDDRGFTVDSVWKTIKRWPGLHTIPKDRSHSPDNGGTN